MAGRYAMKSSRGGPPTKVDWDLVDKYLISGAEGSVIASHLRIKARALYDACKREKKMYFTDYMAAKRSIGVMYVEDKLYENAMKGNIIAQIFWLKNRGMGRWSDRTEVSHEGLPPAINVTIGAKVDEGTLKQLNEFFNGTTVNEGVSGELEGMEGRRAAGHQFGRPRFKQNALDSPAPLPDSSQE
jgi:hypothetical protein